MPGEIVVATAATSLAGDSLPIPAVVAIAAAGSLIGECIVLALARRLTATRRGDRFATGTKTARIRRLLDRWGLGAVIVARFLPGGRTATATYALRPASINRFVIAASIGSLIWATYVVALGSSVTAIA